MEILKPAEMERAPEPTQSAPQPEGADLPFTPDQINAIKYLGISDKLFDDGAMNKLKEIVEYYKTGDLEAIDLKLGNPFGMDRLEKIYSYMRLQKQSDDIHKREFVIEQAKAKYLTQ